MLARPALPSATVESAAYADDQLAGKTFHSGVFSYLTLMHNPDRHVSVQEARHFCICRLGCDHTPKMTVAAFAVPPLGSISREYYCFSVTAEEIDQWRGFPPTKGIAAEAKVPCPNCARSIHSRDSASNSFELTEPHFRTRAASYSHSGDQRFRLAARAATRKGTGLDALSTNKDSMAIRFAPAIAIMAISSLPRFDFLRVVPTWGYATPICYMYANERRECAYPSLSAINASANCKPSWAIPCPVPFITCP